MKGLRMIDVRAVIGQTGTNRLGSRITLCVFMDF